MQARNSFGLTLNPANLPSNELGFTGYAYVSSKNYKEFLRANDNQKPVFVTIKNYIFTLGESSGIDDKGLGLGKQARTYLKVAFTDSVIVGLFNKQEDVEYRLSKVTIDVSLGLSVTKKRLEVDDKDLEKEIRKTYKDQFLSEGQSLLLDYGNNILILRVTENSRIDIGISGQNLNNIPGILTDECLIKIKNTPTNEFAINGTESTQAQSLIDPDFNMSELGVGGLDKELFDIFRRAFTSRRFPPKILKKFGIKHVKGLLLYGPPGTGKTLIARQLSKALKSKEPKIVNGPELFDKYVGETERKIRELFSEAVADQKKLQDQSPLHIIIFDEFDAICKKRGSATNAGVGDSAVNMLLSMIDGVNALNNILVIGMTNRKDMIDEAILRPGRFEIHVEVSLPNEGGRVQIFNIHTKNLKESGTLGDDVNIEKLAKITKNFTGAEIESVVKNAVTLAVSRTNNIMDFKKELDLENTRVEHQDFLRAINEFNPQFGIDSDRFETLRGGKIYDFGPRYKKNQDTILNMINQLKYGKSSQLISVLLEGEAGSGKSCFSAWAALESDFPFVKYISAESFVGYHELGKIDAIVKIFNDAYRSPLSIVVLDDIERIIEFVGGKFSGGLLQALMVLVKKIPTKPENRLLIIGSTSDKGILKELGLYQCFDVIVNMPTLTKEEIFLVLRQFQGDQGELKKISENIGSITIKRLLLLVDMATQGEDNITYNRFMTCYDICGKDEF